MANLVSTFAFLRKKFTDLADFTYSTPTTYIETLTDQQSKIIFACKYDKSRIKSVSSYSSLDSPVAKSSELDLTGSPLKDHCSFALLEMSSELKLAAMNPWTDAEECYCPLKVDDARNILQTVINENFKDSNGSIWVLSDVSEPGKTILIEHTIEQGWNTSGIVKFMGWKPIKSITISSLLATHFACIRNPINTLETQIENVFSIKANLSIKLNSTISSNNPSLIIHNKSTDCTLLQCVSIDANTTSKAKEYWHELLLLNTLKEEILNYKRNKDVKSEPNYTIGSGMEMEMLMEQITKILSDVEIASAEAQTEGLNSEIELAVVSAKHRLMVDITDKLWEILKYCSSYRDLKNAMTFIFQKAAKSNIINLPTNKNRLAELILEVGQNRLAIPCLTGTEPMELLLEIGLEKVTKDYQYIFAESKIYNLNDLKISESKRKSNEPALQVRKSLYNSSSNPVNHGANTDDKQRKTLLHAENRTSSTEKSFVGFQNSRFQQQHVEGTLSQLGQIHLILEHLLLIQANLNLPEVYTSVTEHLLQRPAMQFDTLTRQTFDKAEIPIICDQIFSIIENKEPQARKIVMRSENKFKRMQNTFYHSATPIFPPCFQLDPKVEDRNGSSEVCCLHYLRSSTKNNT